MVHGPAVLLLALSVLGSGMVCQTRSSRVYPAHLASGPGPYLGVNEPGMWKLAIGERCAAGCARGDDHNPIAAV